MELYWQVIGVGIKAQMLGVTIPKQKFPLAHLYLYDGFTEELQIPSPFHILDYTFISFLSPCFQLS